MAFIDCHTHILPGIDDGPRDMEEAVALAGALLQAGFTGVAATPHLDSGITCGGVLERLEELQRELVRRKLPLEVYPGGEYILEPCLPQRLDERALLTLNGSAFLLLEPPLMQPLPHYMDELIFQLRLRGCYPILAHPERSAAFQEDPGRLFSLIRSGVITQVTLSSLTGAFGPAAARTAAAFFAAGAVHLLASDAHSAGRLIKIQKALALAEKLGGPGTVTLMLSGRPAALIENRLPSLPQTCFTAAGEPRRRARVQSAP